MHARVIEPQPRPGAVVEATAIIRGGGAAAGRAVPGWRGLMLLTDPATGHGLIVSLWASAAAMDATSAAYREQAARIEGIVAEPSVRHAHEVSVRVIED